MSGYVLNIGKYMFVFNIGDIILSAVVSLLLTWVIMSFIRLHRLIKAMPAMTAKFFEIKDVIERCHKLFPIEVMEYRGTTFKRGMWVKITLSNSRTFFGSFVGVNAQNMVCVITQKNIIAQEIKAIEDLVPAEQT